MTDNDLKILEHIKKDNTPEVRATLAMRILMEGRFNDFRLDFLEYLYPGTGNSLQVFDLILKETAKNSKLADEILKLGALGPFRRTTSIEHQEGFIFAACLEGMKNEVSPEKLIDRFVAVIYNSDERFPRKQEDLDKLSELIQGLMKVNHWSLQEVGNDVIAHCNEYTNSLKLAPVLNTINDYFLHAKKKSAEFIDKNKRPYSLTLQKGVDNLYLVNKVMKTKGKLRILSSDYYHHDRLSVEVDHQAGVITFFSEKEKDDIFPYFAQADWKAYKAHITEAQLDYPGFAKICKNFAKEKKLTPVAQPDV